MEALGTIDHELMQTVNGGALSDSAKRVGATVVHDALVGGAALGVAGALIGAGAGAIGGPGGSALGAFGGGVILGAHGLAGGAAVGLIRGLVNESHR